MIDAYSILVQVVRSKSGTGGVFNWGNWGRPDIDALIDKAGVELDRAKRLPLMSEALMIVKAEHLFIPCTTSRWPGLCARPSPRLCKPRTTSRGCGSR